MPGFRVTICNYRYAQLCQLCFKVSVTGYVQKVEKKAEEHVLCQEGGVVYDVVEKQRLVVEVESLASSSKKYKKSTNFQ